MSSSSRHSTVFPDEMDRGAAANNMSIGRMLLIWKRSVYKVVIGELVTFLIVFGTLSAIYRNALNEQQKKYFEQSKDFFKKYTDLLSVPFLLGFYITTVAGRWWQQYLTIPWPDRLLLTIRMYVKGECEQAKLVRRVLLRRALLMMTLLLRSISSAVRRNYPTLQSMVKEGIMTKTEKQCYESISPVVNLFWVPATWFVSTLNVAVKEGILKDEAGTKLIMEEFLDFRASCGAVWSYNWVSIPMIYTQVCTLSTYSYFLACVMARQYTGPSNWSVESIDIYFPIGTVVEMLCYIGLLKVAEQIKNPFGDNDEDFDLNYLITRHLNTIHLGLNELDGTSPTYKDAFSSFLSVPTESAIHSSRSRPVSNLSHANDAYELITPDTVSRPDNRLPKPVPVRLD